MRIKRKVIYNSKTAGPEGVGMCSVKIKEIWAKGYRGTLWVSRRKPPRGCAVEVERDAYMRWLAGYKE